MPGFHPRALLDSLLTYPRYLGAIKPGLLAAGEAEFDTRLRCASLAWWPKQLECPVGRRILVIAPHPDDESIGCGGLLLRHRGAADLSLISVFNGQGGGRLERGPWSDDADYRAELVAARRAELAAVTAKLGMEIAGYLDLPDGGVRPSMEDARRLAALVDQVNPDVVLLPWMLNRQRDHRVTNVLYAWGCGERDCMVLGFEIWHMLQPNAVLDIADCLEEKLELIRAYRSQLATVNYLDMAQSLAKMRAFTNPVRADRSGAVEGFLALPNRDYAELVCGLFGQAGKLRPDAEKLF